MAIQVVTPPAADPVSVAEAKAHCRVDSNDEDALIQGLIYTARDYIETVCNRVLMTQTLDYWLQDWPDGDTLKLPRSPAQSVISVTWYNPAGTPTVFAASNYGVDMVTEPGRIVLSSGAAWPGDELRVTNGIAVRFVAGWASAAAVPRSVKQAMLLLIGHWFENREATTFGAVSREVPFAVESLLLNLRVKEY